MNAPHESGDSAELSVGEQVVAALALGPMRKETGIEPLRLGTLRADVTDESMLHVLGHVDGSGRVSARSLLAVLGWRTDERLSIRACHEMVVLERQCSGLDRVRSSRFVSIPAHARASAGIRVGETVLITAVPDRDMLVVHSQASVDMMVLTQICSQGSIS